MKILERKHTQPTFDRGASPSDEETLDRLRAPDDLSGLADVPSIGEPSDVAVAEPHRAATTVRWLRWVPLLVLAVAGAVVAAIVLTNDGPVTQSPWAANEGPPGYSLNVPQVIQTESPWAANEGPPGYSLNVPQVALAESPWATNEGPPGYSLNVPQVALAESPWATNEGPPGYSLNVPQVTQTETPWAANDGPGGHTLNMIDP